MNSTDSARCGWPDEKIPPLQVPIRLQDLLKFARSRAEKKIIVFVPRARPWPWP